MWTTHGPNDGTVNAIAVDPATPTTVSGTGASALLRVNGGAEYCVPFGGAAGGQIANKGATSFKVTNPTAKVCSAGD